MKHSLLLFALLLSMVLMLAGCESESTGPSEDTLTEITSIGANTFSCRVNGQIWLPFKKTTFLDNSGYVAASYQAKGEFGVPQLTIGAQRERSENPSRSFAAFSAIYISIDSIYSTGTYEVQWFYTDSTMKKPDVRRTSILLTGMNSVDGYPGQGIGQVTISRLDTLNKIVSGQFHFKVLTKNNDTVSITDGRFDVQLQ